VVSSGNCTSGFGSAQQNRNRNKATRFGSVPVGAAGRNTRAAGWVSAKAGQKSWSGQVTGLFAEDAPGEKFKDLFTALSAGTEIAFEMSTDVTGDYKYTGTALVTSISLGAPVEDNATYDVTFTGISELVQAVIS